MKIGSRNSTVYSLPAKAVIFALLFQVFFTFTPFVSGQGQTQSQLEAPAADKDDDQSLLFNGQLAKWAKHLEEMPEAEIQRHPYLYFRRWADRPPKIVAGFLLLLMIGALSTYLASKALVKAKEYSRLKFWHSLAIGYLATLISIVCARPMIASGILTPLAFVLIALLELGLLLGLVVSASSIGQTILDRFHLEKLPWFSRKPFLHNFLMIVLGGVVLAGALAIPGIGHLPRIGTRLVALIATLGMGGLIATKLPKDCLK